MQSPSFDPLDIRAELKISPICGGMSPVLAETALGGLLFHRRGGGAGGSGGVVLVTRVEMHNIGPFWLKHKQAQAAAMKSVLLRRMRHARFRGRSGAAEERR